MRVAHIINSNMYSGLENVVCTIMQELQKEIDMIYVTKKGPIIEILKEKKLKYYIIEKMTPKEIKKFIKEWQPDLLHAHDYTASLICALVKGKRPVIDHLHHNGPWLKKINPKSLSFLYAGIRANKILTVSNSIEKEYCLSKMIAKKMQVIGNPVSYNKINEKVNKKKTEKKYDICCIGRLTEAKNPRRFLSVIKEVKEKMPTIKVIWIGSGEMYEEVLMYRNKLKLEENVEFLGFKENPYPDLAASKLFLLTSSWEGYGLVAFEALSLGLPCIVSNVGGLPNIVDKNCGKLCNTNEEFKTKIIELLTDEKILLKYSKKAIEKAKQLDNSKDYLTKMNNLYKELLK